MTRSHRSGADGVVRPAFSRFCRASIDASCFSWGCALSRLRFARARASRPARQLLL